MKEQDLFRSVREAGETSQFKKKKRTVVVMEIYMYLANSSAVNRIHIQLEEFIPWPKTSKLAFFGGKVFFGGRKNFKLKRSWFKKQIGWGNSCFSNYYNHHHLSLSTEISKITKKSYNGKFPVTIKREHSKYFDPEIFETKTIMCTQSTRNHVHKWFCACLESWWKPRNSSNCLQ